MITTIARDMNLKEACGQLGCTRQTFVRWVMQGIEGRRLHAWKIGNQWRTNQEAIDAFKAYPGAAAEISAPSDDIRSRGAAALARIRQEFGS